MRLLSNKLTCTAGFTLAEQLVSIIFIGLLCVAVSVGISAALAVFGSVSDQAQANQLLSRSMQEVNNELSYSHTVQEDGIRFMSPSTRTFVELGNDADGNGIAMAGTDIGGSGIGQVLFVPKANGLVPYFSTAPLFDKETNTWTYSLQIRKNETVLKEQDMKVVRAMPVAASDG